MKKNLLLEQLKRIPYGAAKIKTASGFGIICCESTNMPFSQFNNLSIT